MASQRASRGFTAVLAFAAVGIVFALAAVFSQDQDQAPRGAGLVPVPVIPDVCGGTVSSLEATRATASFPLVMPSHSLASEQTLARAWTCSETEIAFEFESGVVVYESINTLRDPEAEWKSLADEYPEFSVGTVKGVSASFADPSIGDGSVGGGVEFVVDGVRVSVSGDGTIPLEQLVSVSESLTAWSTPSTA